MAATGRQKGVREVGLLTAALALSGAGVWVGVARTIHQPPHGPHVSWWILAIISFFANRSGIRLYMTRTSFNSGITEIPLVLALFFSAPVEPAIGFVLGQLGVELLRPSRAWWRAAFAMSLHALLMMLAVIVFRALVPAPSPLDFHTWLPVGVVVLLYNVRVGAASSVVRFVSGKWPPLRDIRGAVAYSYGSASVGLLAAILVAANPWAIVWLAPIAIALGISLRLHATEFAQRQALEILAGVGSEAAASMDFEETIHLIASRLRGVFRAKAAEITLYIDPPAAKGYRTVVDVDESDEIVRPVAADVTPIAIEGLGGGTIVNASSANGEIKHAIDRYGAADGIIVPVRASGRLAGYIFIAGHVDGKDGAYRQGALTTLQSLAVQAGQLLENRQLATALSELSQREAELTYRAFHDPLTGMPTRAVFLDRLSQKLAQCDAGRVLVGLLDIDQMDVINHRYGRAAGDYILVALSQRLRPLLARGETVARFGSDEIAILMELPPDDEPAAARVREVMSVVEEPMFYAADIIGFSATVAFVTSAAAPGAGVENPIVRAAAELRTAKENGGGRLRIDGEEIVFAPVRGMRATI